MIGSYKILPEYVKKEWGGDTFKHASGDKIGEVWLYSNVKPYITKTENDVSIIDKVPVLLKYIDAAYRLSVQVHPDDDSAKKYYNQPNGKNELWIIDDPGKLGYIYLGLKRIFSENELFDFVENDKFEQCLKKVYVKKGDIVYIPAGTVHCLMEGMKVVEIQQPSDITFRIYDWGRKFNGKPRELHIKEALPNIKFTGEYGIIGNILNSNDSETNFNLRHFSVRVVKIKEGIINTGDKPSILYYMQGAGAELNGHNIICSDTYYIDAKTELNIRGDKESIILIIS